ncbi:DUF6869 domain-containing protein [Rhodanobacter sp. C01]|uniref:DUF6869 domain-containing protein n=1 Tax=Rhodanobacter sp. C01 TaxID=1945856 RepID=UPI000985E455|nr:hypothetical protein [Rhodanobacter sp. C01]OOG50139.1 hypothetical protein B0E50_03115 [Rhodanobacter sp. C01]
MNAASDIDIAKAWVVVHKAEMDSEVRDANFWAYMSLDELRESNLERYWKVINEIWRLDDSDLILSNLAAGPIEDLLVSAGNIFIERIEVNTKVDERFRVMLGMVWKDDMPDDIWERVERAS